MMSCHNDGEMSSASCVATVDDVTKTSQQLLVNTTTTDTGDEWLHVTVATVAVTAVIVTIVLGNTLVIVAIAADRRLKGVQNWFIASLAVSDLLVGVFITPLSTLLGPFRDLVVQSPISMLRLPRSRLHQYSLSIAEIPREQSLTCHEEIGRVGPELYEDPREETAFVEFKLISAG